MANVAQDCSDASKLILTKYHCRFIVPGTVYEIKYNLSSESIIAACMSAPVAVVTVSIVDGWSFFDIFFSLRDSERVGIVDTECGLKAKASSSFDGRSICFDFVLI